MAAKLRAPVKVIYGYALQVMSGMPPLQWTRSSPTHPYCSGAVSEASRTRATGQGVRTKTGNPLALARGRQSAPYNLLFTRRWMLCCPPRARAREKRQEGRHHPRLDGQIRCGRRGKEAIRQSDGLIDVLDVLNTDTCFRRRSRAGPRAPFTANWPSNRRLCQPRSLRGPNGAWAHRAPPGRRPKDAP
jgi:hypothetical protein